MRTTTGNTINTDVTMGGASATLLAGRYRVVRQLGQGGMGSVWLAEDTQLDDRKVAVKMLPSILVANKRAYNQLKAEALVSLKLTHPNIAAVRAFEENNGNPFLVVDFIDGQTLDDYLAEKGTLTEEETIRLLAPVAAALDYAHGEGVVHRDVKPANVMIRKDGHPFVLDFGIAREIQETLTRVTGKLSSGTLLYMSPEQLKGESPTAAQDVYSFAAMAYECLMGRPPFHRGDIEYQILHESPAPLDPHIAISGSVMAGLAKDAECRPTNCAAVLTAGREKVVGVKKSSTSKKPLVALCVAGALLIAGVFGWQSWQRQQEAERARIAEQARIVAERKAAEAKRRADEAEARRKAEEERKAREEAARIAAEQKVAEEKRRADELEAKRKDGEERKAREEAARIAAERKAAEEKRKADEAEAKRKAEEERKARAGGVQLWKDGPYWAECNVGASKPEEAGYYFWWGDTVGYQHVGNGWKAADGSRREFTFSEGNCPTCGKDTSQLRAEGYIDSTGNLVAAHDAATAHLGDPWRMPTEEECEALKEHCTSVWTQRNGVSGQLVTGKGEFASKSIFLPAAGYGYGFRLDYAGSYGIYWSSTPYSGLSNLACSLYFYSGYFDRSNYSRYGGQSVRPVRGSANRSCSPRTRSSTGDGLDDLLRELESESPPR